MLQTVSRVVGLGVASVAATATGAILFASGVTKLQDSEIRSESRQILPGLANTHPYIDTYSCSISLPDTVSSSNTRLLTLYLQSFFNSVPFQMERKILRLASGEKQVTNADVDAMQFDKVGRDKVYMFKLMERTETEAAFKWGMETSGGVSWFGVQGCSDDRNRLDLMFASALEDNTHIAFKVFLPFHLLYAQVLLKCAALRMQHSLDSK